MNFSSSAARRWGLQPALGIAGAVLLILSLPLAVRGVRPFATHTYEICWWSLIALLDGLIWLRRGRSSIAGSPLRLLLLALWSVGFWFAFELLNLRLRNWHYIFVYPETPSQWLGSFLAYSTVLPGITLMAEWLEVVGPGNGNPDPRRPRPIPARTPLILAALGAASFLLPLLWPRWFFPLIWVGLVFLLDPLNRRLRGRSLLGEWEGGWSRTLLLYLAAGAVCGLIWELLNFWARTKWIYTVPFFEELKLFEMPFLGFLGFPPFALECWVFVQTLEVSGLIPKVQGEDESAAMAGNPPRGKGLWRRLLGPPGPLAAALVVAVAAATFLLPLMDRLTFASLYPTIDQLQDLKPAERAELRSRGIRDCFDLRADLERRGEGRSRFAGRLDLILHAGIGIEVAEALRDLGIDDLEALARADPEELRRKLGACELRHSPTAAEVRYWVRKALTPRR